jgi:protein SCO1/2
MFGIPRKLFIALVALLFVSIILFVSANFVLHQASEARFAGTLLDPPLAVQDFELSGANGPVKRSDFQGKIVVLFFGYTSCPDVCPTTLASLKKALQLLGDEAESVQVIMVAIDPERDTPDRVSQYVSGFNPSFVGLSGTLEQIAEVASRYGIYYARADSTSDGGYLVDHTATVSVLDREGRTRLLWSFGTTPEEMASDLRRLL